MRAQNHLTPAPDPPKKLLPKFRERSQRGSAPGPLKGTSIFRASLRSLVQTEPPPLTGPPPPFGIRGNQGVQINLNPLIPHLQDFRSLTPVTVLSAASEYSSSMNQKDRTEQLWQYRLSVALDSLYPLQILDFVETTRSDSDT